MSIHGFPSAERVARAGVRRLYQRNTQHLHIVDTRASADASAGPLPSERGAADRASMFVDTEPAAPAPAEACTEFGHATDNAEREAEARRIEMLVYAACFAAVAIAAGVIAFV